MATLTRGQTFTASDTVTNTKLHNLVDLGTVADINRADASTATSFVTISGTAPSAPKTGELWFDTGAGLLKYWSGSAWTAVSTVSGTDHFRSGYQVKFSTTSVVQITAGVLSFSDRGVRVTSTANQTLDVSSSGNYVSGSPATDQHVYIVVKSDGTLKLTTDAPNAADTAGSTAGRLQYRSISATYYRYLGSVRMNSSTTYLQFSRMNNYVQYGAADLIAGSLGATTFTAQSVATRVPATSLNAHLVLSMNHAATTSTATLRETGAGASGISVGFNSIVGGQDHIVTIPCNTSQSVDYKVATSGDLLTLNVLGYFEELD